MQSVLAIILLCLALASHPSFVDTAPISQEKNPIEDSTPEEEDSDVRDLENLKNSIGKIGRRLDLIKSKARIYTNLNGEKESHSELNEEIKENEELIAKVAQHVDTIYKPDDKSEKALSQIRTDVDIPSEGIHKSLLKVSPEYKIIPKGSTRSSFTSSDITATSESSLSNDKADNLGIQYSPLDMAEYVFWTGDEKGVTLAIEEFLQEGLMSREEAISFLQDIIYSLQYLENHYTQLGLNFQRYSKIQDTNKNTEQNDSNVYEKLQLQNSLDVPKVKLAKKTVQIHQLLPIPNQVDVLGKKQELDYDELMERLRVADFLYTKYSLEEVIYQLAKVMFTQSLTRGSGEAQQALQKFTTFLEVEAEQGHISRALEKKVLDVLIAALSDTLLEHPDLLSVARDSLVPTVTNEDGQHFAKQVLELSPDEKYILRDLFAHSEQNRHNELQDKVKESKITQTPFDKYKNT